MSQGYRIERRDPAAAKAKRIEAARVRKALAICDVLWALGANADQADALSQDDRERACKLTGRKGEVSPETWARVVSTLRTWERRRPPESRGGAVDLIARLGGPAAEIAAQDRIAEGNALLDGCERATPSVFDELAKRGLAAKARDIDTLAGD